MLWCLPDRQLAAEQGIVAADITRRSSSRSLPTSVNARHARFAAACAIDETVSEQPIGAVAQKWGRLGLLKGGESLKPRLAMISCCRWRADQKLGLELARASCACFCQCRATMAANIRASTTNTKDGFRHEFNGSSVACSEQHAECYLRAARW